MQLNKKHGVNFLYIFSSCLEKHFELKISLRCQSPQVNKFTRLSKCSIQDFAKEGKIGRGDKLLKMVLSPSAILEFPSKRFLKLTVFLLWGYSSSKQRVSDYVWERHTEGRAVKRRRAMWKEGADKERKHAEN